MTNTVLEKLKKQQAQIEARIKSLKAKDAIQKRKDETHKKILAGAYILDKNEKEGTLQSLIEALDSFLVRKNERALFGLPEKMGLNMGNEVVEVSE